VITKNSVAALKPAGLPPKPAARKLGLSWINWRCLRTSHATWMVEAGANPKDVQGQMRHSRISTTMDIYAQFVPESQRRALAKMSAMVEARTSKANAAKIIENMVARDGVEPPMPAFSVGLCCSLNDLRDSGWPPKSLKSR
jgi:hypothetical protein